MDIRTAVKSGNMKIRVEDLNLRIRLNAACGDLALAGSVYIDSLRTIAVDLEYDILEVEDDLRNVLLDAGNR